MQSTRLALLELARRQRLSPDAFAAMARLAASERPATTYPATLRRGAQALAMLLMGLGVVFFIAANWKTRSPVPMFAGLEALVLGACLGAARLGRLRTPLALLGFLAAGALLAFFGQYYQTGADPWQLFAIWSALLLPLAFACRSDLLWTAWIVVAMTAVSTWLSVFHGGFDDQLHGPQMAAMVMALGLCALLSRPLRRFTGAGDWSLSLAILFAVILIAGCGVWGLFTGGPMVYLASLAALACGATHLGQGAGFDIRGLSMCALGIDALVIGGALKMISDTRSFEAILFFISLVIIVALYATATILLGLNRHHTAGGARHD